mgnify:CR=1 FL=1
MAQVIQMTNNQNIGISQMTNNPNIGMVPHINNNQNKKAQNISKPETHIVHLNLSKNNVSSQPISKVNNPLNPKDETKEEMSKKFLEKIKELMNLCLKL